MTTPATHNAHENTTAGVLFVAFALREQTWKLGCSIGHGQPPRERTLPARDQKRLRDDIDHATGRFGLPHTVPVVRGDEAGRAGFWRHRFLQAQGLSNPGGDSSAIAGNRRKRRAKSDALDGRTLLRMLMRYHHGERQVWRVVHVPAVEAAAQRHRHRDLETLKHERARTTNRIQGLLRSQGGRLARVNTLPEPLAARRLGDGAPLPSGLRRRVLRVEAHDACLDQQISALEADRRALLRSAPEAKSEKGRQLMQRKGIGSHGSWWLVRAFCGWRALKTRREVGG
jgi:transposase